MCRVSKGSAHSITGWIRTWDDLALPQGLHQAVHLFLCQQEVEVVLEGKAGKVLASNSGGGYGEGAVSPAPWLLPISVGDGS